MKGYTHTVSLALTLALLAAALLATVAAAHGVELLESDPLPGASLEEAPPEVWARFGQALDAGKSKLQVFDSSAVQVDDGEGRVDIGEEQTTMSVGLPPLPDDVYTVRWYAVLADGDATEGLFRFTVGEPSIAANQVKLPPPLPAGEETGLPIIWIAAASGVVLLALLGLLLRRRQIQRGRETV